MTDEEFDRKTEDLMKHVGKYVKEMYGPRCPDSEEGCPVCDMWALHDKLFEFTAFAPEKQS